MKNIANNETLAELGPFTDLARGVLGHMSVEQGARGESHLHHRFSRPPRTQRPAWLATSLAAAAALAIASSLLVKYRVRANPSPLSYVVESNRSASNRSLDSSGGSTRLLRFSDGTEVRMDPGTQARVRFVTDHGAALAMTSGTLHATVIHSPTSDWRFDAGPFIVHVTGTEFGLSWDPERDQFDLRMEHGSVTVTSPVANDAIPVRAGQWLTIHARSNEVFIRDLRGIASREASPAEPAVAGEPGVAANEPALAASEAAATAHDAPVWSDRARGAKPGVGHNWARDLARGKFEPIVKDALGRGWEACLSESSSGELAALADAARYTRHDDLAREALLTERRRFAGSANAIAASLLLGRLAAANDENHQALTWFDTYLAEAPSGAYASEALGRKMAIKRDSAAPGAAQALAGEYLSKYPEGTYSSAARALLNHP